MPVPNEDGIDLIQAAQPRAPWGSQIVTGHSHAGGALETGHTLLLNSGGCLEGRFQYVSMNPVTLEHRFNSVW